MNDRTDPWHFLENKQLILVCGNVQCPISSTEMFAERRKRSSTVLENLCRLRICLSGGQPRSQAWERG